MACKVYKSGKRSEKSHSKKWLILIILLFVVVASFTTYKIYQSRKREHRVVIPSTAPTETTAPKSTGSTSDKQAAPASQPSTSSSSQKSTAATTGSAPLTPSGQFISNHSPGGDNPTKEQSVCNTSPGAVCYIQFTKGTIVKKLDAQTADSNGTTIWNWDVKEAGLTAGSWQVSATATLNGQSVTAQDQQLLEIK